MMEWVRRHTWLTAAVLMAPLFVVLVVAIALPGVSEERARQDRVRLEAADVAFSVALGELDAVLGGYLPHPASEDDEIDPVLGRTQAALDQLDIAEEQMRAVSGSGGRERYLDAISDAREAAEALNRHAKASRNARDAIADGDRAYADADKEFASAIKAGDADDFSAMLAHAQKAQRRFKEARQLYAGAERVYPGSSFAGWIEDSRLSAEMAKVAEQMARAGAAGRFEAYNAAVDRLDEIERMRQNPDVPAEQPAVDFETEVRTKASDALARATAAHALARGELGRD